MISSYNDNRYQATIDNQILFEIKKIHFLFLNTTTSVSTFAAQYHLYLIKNRRSGIWD